MKYTVLIIDDNPDIVDIMKTTVSMIDGCRSVPAYNFDEAEKLLLKTKFDIVICDCVIEEKRSGGEQLYHLVRSKCEDHGESMPYWIFISGESDTFSRVIDLPFSTFFQKPIKAMEFRGIIQSATDTLRFLEIDNKLGVLSGKVDGVTTQVSNIQESQTEVLTILRTMNPDDAPGEILDKVEGRLQRFFHQVKEFWNTAIGKMFIIGVISILLATFGIQVKFEKGKMNLGFIEISIAQTATKSVPAYPIQTHP